MSLHSWLPLGEEFRPTHLVHMRLGQAGDSGGTELQNRLQNFTSPHSQRYWLALHRIDAKSKYKRIEKTFNLVNQVNIRVQHLPAPGKSCAAMKRVISKLSNWNAKAHLEASASFFLNWNDHNIDFLMKLIRMQKKEEQAHMGSNDKWDKRQSVIRRPPNDFTKSQITRSDHIFSRKSQSIAIYSCLGEFPPNGRASLLQGKWLRDGSLLQLY